MSGDQKSWTFGNGAVLDKTIFLYSEAPFQTFSYSFSVDSPDSAPLSFAAGEDGWIGLMLDNIELTSSETTIAEAGMTLWFELGVFRALRTVGGAKRERVAGSLILEHGFG